ncbi:transcriptional regulator, MarR family [Methanoplanus limicola DSM 2279]|uniref:Transcriptional regulator, MarR family n=2 Tax=Methanoplanus limicola TaxID=2315 RepID=H1Z4L2_9EURY|nr:transcriptional regulator, MarR family [Methanoplanus limicola DSM 2279]
MFVIIILSSFSSAVSGEYIVTPYSNEYPEDMPGVDFSGADGNETFADLPLWVQVSEIVCLIFSLFAIIKYLPVLIGKTKTYRKNPKRNLILDYISENPGATLSDIERSLMINRGTLRYHIDILNSSHKISIMHRGNKAHLFYNSGRYSENQKKAIVISGNEAAMRIISIIDNNPGITNKQIAVILGVNKGTVTYHIRKLKEAETILEEKAGTQKMYSINSVLSSKLKN